jgi:hypothetical protein
MDTAPPKIPLPFAASAAAPYISAVPLASQIGITNGAASFTDGFPPNAFVSLSSGGAGPFGRDFNGLLNQTTAGLQWLQAGGGIFYDSAFSTNIGGYPVEATIKSASFRGKYWISTVSGNTNNPDTTPTNWQAFYLMPADPLTVPHGGTGLTIVPTGVLLVGNGVGTLNGVSPHPIPGTPLLSNGTGADPDYGVLNLSGGFTSGKVAPTQSPVSLLLFDVTPGTRNFTVPSNTFFICAMVHASGGGGAALNATHGGGGGGAGGYAGFPGADWIAVSPGDVISYTVPDGGAGGGGGDGSNGGIASFGAYFSASGGIAGNSVANSGGGLGGTGAFMTSVQFIGGDGSDGDHSGSNLFAGNGGAGFFGGGSRGAVGTTVTGERALGSGGGGTYNSAGAGLPGQKGCVIVWG